MPRETPIASFVASIYVRDETLKLENLQKLLELGADPTIVDKDGNSPLHLIANFGWDDIKSAAVRELVSAGAEVDCLDSLGATPLENVRINDPELIKTFLEVGADPDKAFSSVLMKTISKDGMDCYITSIEHFLNFGANTEKEICTKL